MLKLIGVAGRMQAGKTEFANLAVKEFGATKLAFADALKDEVMQVLLELGVVFKLSNLYGDKKEDEYTVTFETLRNADLDVMLKHLLLDHANRPLSTFAFEMSYRKLMQVYGTEYRRKQDPEYWVKKTRAAVQEALLRGTKLVVIDDVRFPDEAQMVLDEGGILVRVERPVDRVVDEHISETALDGFKGWSWGIFNGGDLTDYHDEVRRCLRVMLGEGL